MYDSVLDGNITVPGADTTCILTNLKPFHNYTIHMDAESRAGNGDASEQYVAVTRESGMYVATHANGNVIGLAIRAIQGVVIV